MSTTREVATAADEYAELSGLRADERSVFKAGALWAHARFADEIVALHHYETVTASVNAEAGRYFTEEEFSVCAGCGAIEPSCPTLELVGGHGY